MSTLPIEPTDLRLHPEWLDIIPHAGLYATSEDLGYPALGIGEIIELIRGINVLSSLPTIAGLNVALQATEGDIANFNTRMAIDFLGVEDTKRLLQQPQFRKAFTWVTPWHFRVLILLLVKFGRRVGGKSLSDEGVCRSIGKVLLSVGESCRPSITPGTGLRKGLEIELQLNSSGYRNLDRYPTSLSVKERVIERLSKDDSFVRLVKGSFGFTPLQLQMALTSIWATSSRLSAARLMSAGSFVLDLPYHFGLLGLTKCIGNFVLDKYCLDLRNPSSSDDGGWLYSASELVDRPLAKLDDTHLICLDLDFMLLKVMRGVWNLHPILGEGSAAKLGSLAGEAFEEYCKELLRDIEAIGKEKRPCRLFTKDELGRGRLDDFLLEGDFGVAFEYKSGVLPSSALYGTSIDSLSDAIDKKYVLGGRDPSGFSQILNHLEFMQAHGKLDPSLRVRPCLVVEDDTLTYAPAYTYAVRRAQELFRASNLNTLKPVILHIDDLFGILERSRIASLSTQLARIATTDMWSALSVKNALLLAYPIKAIPVSQVVPFERATPIMEQMIPILENQAIEPVSSLCPDCGDQRVSFRMNSGTQRWFCNKCGVSSDRCLTDAEEGEIQAQRREAIARYNNSNC